MRTLILLASCIVASPLMAQTLDWVQVGQTEWPYRPDIGALFQTPAGALLACTTGRGIYRSVNEGESWSPSGLEGILWLCGLTATDNAIFTGTWDGVYKSEDDGVTWAFTGFESQHALDVKTDEAGHLWAIVQQGASREVLYRSDDGGETWAQVATDIEIGGNGLSGLPTLSISPDGVLFVHGQYGLFRSADAGVNWVEVDVAPSYIGQVTSSDIAFSSSDISYVGTRSSATGREQGISRSLDGGLTWTRITSLDATPQTVAITGEGSLVIGLQGGGLIRSGDGEVWESAGLNALRRSVASILVDEDGTPSLLGTDKGVYHSAISTEWVAVNDGFVNRLIVYSMRTVGDQVFAAANGDVYQYDAGTNRWALPPNEGLQTTPYTYELWTDGSSLFTSTSYGLFKSDDAGTTWVKLPLPEENVRAFTSISSGMLVAGAITPHPFGSFGDLYASEDGGITWEVLVGWDESVNGAPFAIAETLAGTLLVGASVGKFAPGGIYRSDDSGESWTGPHSERPRDIAVTPAGTVVAAGESGHFRSIDDGLSWEAIDSAGAYDIEITTAGGIASVHFDGDVYRSFDEGATWQQASAGLDGISLTSDSESFVYVGTTGEGVFRSAVPLAVSSEGEAEASLPFALAPGYPNPFAASTRIPFTLSEAGPVSLTVHDVLGRRVATLVDAVLPAGEHAARWEAAGATSGLYLATLRAGEEVTVQRITIAR